MADPADARWLQACQWPEEPARLTRLRAASPSPPTIRRDVRAARCASTELRVATSSARAAHALPVVVSTWVLTYLPVARQQALMAELESHRRRRGTWPWSSSEQPERVPGIPVPPRPDGEPDGRATALVRIEWRDGERTVVRLADQHPHGRVAGVAGRTIRAASGALG